MRHVTRAEFERAARMYHRNKDATQALGIHSSTFAKRCKRYGIETPAERKKRARTRRDYQYLERFGQTKSSKIDNQWGILWP